jgi:hypothetical protein
MAKNPKSPMRIIKFDFSTHCHNAKEINQYFIQHGINDLPFGAYASKRTGIDVSGIMPNYQGRIIRNIDRTKIRFRYFQDVSNVSLVFDDADLYVVDERESVFCLTPYPLLMRTIISGMMLNNKKPHYRSRIIDNRDYRVYQVGKPNDYYPYGGLVLATYLDKDFKLFNSDEGVMYVGMAICHQDDEFDKKIGQVKAIDKLFANNDSLGRFMVCKALYDPPGFYGTSNLNRVTEYYLNNCELSANHKFFIKDPLLHYIKPLGSTS